MKKVLFALFSITIFLSTLFLFNLKLGVLPPAGKFLSPYSGFWQNNMQAERIPDYIEVTSLNDTIKVFFDKNGAGVPHIFTKNDYSLYFAQGYITARDRLWQMEFQSIVASGRLSEFVGKDMIELDKFMRKIDLPASAERATEEMMKNKELADILIAYSEGVNAYIDQLTNKTLPVEYKILDYEPEHWKPVKTALLLKLMALDLTGYNKEMQTTIAHNNLPEKIFRFLYPSQKYYTEPIVKSDRKIKLDTVTNSVNYKYTSSGYNSTDNYIGSNNWAVAPKKTKSGNAILCNDPHLGLQLPSLWYELQLNSPGVNVYGASLPGAPGIIIGFNEKISWGVTNAGSDVMDWFEIEFTDSTRTKYNYNGMELPVKRKVEVYKVRGSDDVVDTILYTHHGPVSYLPGENPYKASYPVGCALRWTAHDPSLEALTFIKLNRAKNYNDFVVALNEYDCPGQNFIYADVEGNIAYRHQGKFPKRKFEQGRFINNGADSTSEWRTYIPFNDLPSQFNPARGFVSSANQAAINKESYPYYLGDTHAGFERGKRINDILRANNHIDKEFMTKMQLDNYNLYSEKLLPIVLGSLSVNNLNKNELVVHKILSEWKYNYDANEKAPHIFELLLDNIEKVLLADDITIDSTLQLFSASRDVTLKILEENNAYYIDNINTNTVEDIHTIVDTAFKQTVNELLAEHENIDSLPTWGAFRGTDIKHVAKIPGFNIGNLVTGGNYTCINATNKHFGPSWRMIVEMGNPVTAYTVYPGGQSGNPGSEHYSDKIENWRTGKYYKVDFLYSEPDATTINNYNRMLLK